MNQNTKENSLIKVNENSIVYKIKQFFKNLFKTKTKINNYEISKESIDKTNNIEDTSKNDFFKRIQTIDDENTLLLKLQKQYENGEVSEESLTPKQIDDLCNLYEKQIDDLKEKINNIKNQIIQYQNK